MGLQRIEVFLFLTFFSLAAVSADRDHDGILDKLEYALADRFAPEWRFHARVSGKKSKQNQNEIHFPQGINDWFKELTKERGNVIRVRIQNDNTKRYLSVTDISELDCMIDPKTGLRLDDPGWKWYRNGEENSFGNPSIALVGIPKFCKGDSAGFPTYFTCRPGECPGEVVLSYFLFFPYDFKGYRMPFNTGDHRGDWEGISIKLRCVEELGSVNSLNDAQIDYIVYSGHGHQKFLYFQTKGFHAKDYTHTQVYISWGSHCMYPEPGEWHNYKSPGPNIYDDFFYGNGKVVKSWKRSIINLGESQFPFVGWLNYRGRWGKDKTGKNSSPPSPPGKSIWKANIQKRIDWNTAIENYKDYWEKSPILIKR